MTVKVRETTDPAWAEFVLGHPDATIFHHPAWASLLAECYGYRPFVLASLDARGKIDAGMPFMEVDSPLTGHRWVSLPFSDFCTPLYRDPTALNALVEYLVCQERQQAIPRVEIHAGIPGGDGVFHAASFVWSRVRLNASADAMLKTFDKTRVREPIRAAARRGVDVRQCTSKSGLYTFYDMLADTHQRLGVPVQPKRFFSLVWDRLIEKGLGFLLLAYKDSAPIAGTLYLHHGEMLTAKYNASLLEFWGLRPNHLVYWSGIRWGCENGYRYFDFGRTAVDNQHLRDFKQGWGAEEEPLPYTTISGREPNVPSRRSREIISVVIRRSPLFVCRALGEMLYGHYA
jgi:CelD/BcsL family acetyltransferase involved in cellulose biosynthesis